jgi:hypothetical protein
MNKIVDRIYLATSFAGAAIIAANVNANVLGYVLFLVSSVLGAYMVAKSNASHELRSLLKVNIVFAVINVVGIVRYY